MKKSVSTETDLWKLIKALIPQPHRVSLPLCASLSVKDCCWALLSSPDPYLPLPLTFASYQVSDDVAESSAGHGPHTQFNLLICHFLRDRGPFILQPYAKTLTFTTYNPVPPPQMLLRPTWALLITDVLYVNLLPFVYVPPNKRSGGSWDAPTVSVGQLRAAFKFGFSRLAKSQGIHKWNQCLCSKLRVPLNWSAPLKASASTSSLSPAWTKAHVFTFQLHLQ